MFLPLNLAVAEFLFAVAGVDYRLATIAGYGVHVIGLFFVGRVWVFSASWVHPGRVVLAGVIHTASFFFILGLTILQVEYFEFPFFSARVIASVVVGVLWDFPMDSRFSFNTRLRE
jgi:putative flippase GtrA